MGFNAFAAGNAVKAKKDGRVVDISPAYPHIDAEGRAVVSARVKLLQSTLDFSRKPRVSETGTIMTNVAVMLDFSGPSWDVAMARGWSCVLSFATYT